MSNCDYCGEAVTSVYSFQHMGVWYSGHKRCMGAPMVRKLSQPMPLPNIGLIGKLRAGKDVVAAYLAEKYGYTRFAFGDELKRYAHELFGEPAEGSKPRELYQWFGQTVRERDPDVWVRKCLEAASHHELSVKVAFANRGLWSSTPQFRAVITDVRQLNEAEVLSARGYVLIRVEAPESLRIHRAIESGDTFNLRDLTHGTETALDGYAADFTVMNGAGLPELYAQIDEIMESLRVAGGEAA
ncbi:dephospho-CoA kinase [Fontibacillus phaseoli]|uniref:Dephospho-CoA kinase n=2 Tax=Fontibacillus phaseoli TaxID=1416533 RepID=A0A369BQQ1_9BACL|nr:dephospho-CoA kinase [Fontibacillus phaseoli]